MRQTKLACAIACLLVLGSAAPGRAQSNEGGIESDRRNEKVVRDLYDKFESAWNRHDPAALGGMWTIDGDHLEPDGTAAKGRAAIIRLFTRQHETVFKGTEIHLTIDDVWFLGGGDIALVDGSYQLAGAVLPDGTPLPARKGHLTAVLLHENASWAIVASRLMIPAVLPYKKS